MSWGPLQAQPTGLLGLLQLKNRGRSPQSLQETLQGVWDLQRLYLQAQVEDAIESSVAAAPLAAGGAISFTTPGPLTVPEGELWYVQNFSILAILAAGDTVTGLRPLCRYVTTGLSRFGRLGTDVASKVGAGRIMVSAGDFYLNPGNELLGFCENLASAGTVAMSGWLHYTRLQI